MFLKVLYYEHSDIKLVFSKTFLNMNYNLGMISEKIYCFTGDSDIRNIPRYRCVQFELRITQILIEIKLAFNDDLWVRSHSKHKKII